MTVLCPGCVKTTIWVSIPPVTAPWPQVFNSRRLSFPLEFITQENSHRLGGHRFGQIQRVF
jgi:hypothetical protein